MCEIVASCGPYTGAVISGPRDVEYRGYDSAGIAAADSGVTNTAPDVPRRLLLPGRRIRCAVQSGVIRHPLEREIDDGAAPFDALRRSITALPWPGAIALLSEAVHAAPRSHPSTRLAAAQGPAGTADGHATRSPTDRHPKPTVGRPLPRTTGSLRRAR